MSLIFPYILFTCFFMALYLSVKSYQKDKLKYLENRLFSLLCFFSALWSFGFWGVNIQTEPENAYIFRAIGMIGVFTYLIIAQLLICVLGRVKKFNYILIAIVSVIGYTICFFIVQKDQVIYRMSEIGMTYRFNKGFWNTAYILYCICIAINIFLSICYMMQNSFRKRNQVLAKKLLFVEFIIIIGMVMDTLFPLFGIFAVPGSTIGQFIGLTAMYQAICFVNRYRITIDNMSTYVYYSLTTPVLVYDHNYELQITNDVAHDFIGLKETEVGATGIDSLFSIEPEEAFRFNGNRKDIDVICQHNQLHCSLSISKIHDDYYDIIGYIITVTDLSERVNAISRLKNAMDEARNANQAKTTFLANMSHEIRTPMNAILGYTELVLKENLSGQVREYMNGIHLSARNLLAIINDILDITKIESGKMELIPDNYFFADLLDDVSLIISQQASQKGLAFVMKTDEHIPTQMYGDKVRIRGVLINILNNAVKYTKEGTITFETKVLSAEDDTVKLAFIISDTGVGIRHEDQKNLFKSFERLDPQLHYGIEGSGLGLSIAKGYVTLMGGDIAIESEYGAGSVFTVTIDQKVIDNTPMERRFAIDKHAEKPSGSCKLTIHDTRVLLVDDNTINLMVAKALLNSYGLSVDTAASGTIAITACKSFHYPIIFMDQMMPDMDGIEAMRQIRALDPYYKSGGDSRIIVLTANAIRGSREQLIAEGFDEYLGKPLNLRQLERLLILYLPSDKINITSILMDDSDEYGEPENTDGSEISYLQKTLSELDVPLGLKNCGGSISDYLNILKINYTYGNKNLDELKDMLGRKDYENYTIKIHSIKSTALGIGAVNASNMALEQEKAGRAGEYDYIDQHYEAFRSEYISLLKKIEEVLHHYDMLTASIPEAGEEALDSRMLSGILLNIRKHVDNFEFGKIFEILDEMKKYPLSAEYQEIFGRLTSLMDELAVDDIRQFIEDTLADME